MVGLKKFIKEHDLDSRLIYKAYDAREDIQSLRPYYPVDNEQVADKYWAQHYAIIKEGPIRFVLLNSSAYHGFNDEMEHGRVSDKTIRQLKLETDS
jgi:hypothetical protein